MKTIGVILTVLGLVVLAYGGYQATTDKTILEVGSISVTTSEHKDYAIPVITGIALLLGGIALLGIGARRLRPR